MKEFNISDKLAAKLAEFHAQPLKVGDYVLIAKSETALFNGFGWPYGGRSQNVNFAGVQMSKEHLDFVKSIQV